MKVGMIGLGAMGAGMAVNLAGAGFLKALYNRTEAKAVNLAAQLNVQACLSPQQLAAECNVIISSVSADADVLEMIEAITETMQPGTIVIDTSTVSRQTACKAAAMLAQKQGQFLDAPVSGGVEGAKKGKLAIMVGGESSTLDTVRPVLESISSRIVHIGQVGSGQATKAVNQIMAAGINQAVTEALAFAKAEQLPMEKVIDVVSGGAAGNWFLQHRGLTMTQGKFQPGFKLALHHKDLKICQQMAELTDSSLTLVEKTLLDYEELIEQGLGDEDISALYRLKSS